MAYRDDVTALSARHDALAAELAATTRELDDARQLLDQARARSRLPVLHNLRVAAPCTADWNQMTGDDRVRNCGQCQKSVFNLSGMTRDEAEALLIERNGELCVRYYQRADGTILLADCTVQTGHNHHRWVAAGAAALLAGSIGAAAALSQLPPPERLPAPEGRHMLGALPPPPPPAPPAPRWSIDQGTPTMGEVRALAWDEPPPAQPPAHPTRHRPATAGKRAR